MKYCCIKGCSNALGKSPTDLKFYYFPSPNPNMIWKCDKRMKWIDAVKNYVRNTSSNWEPKKQTCICCHHFVGNKKSEHPLHPAYLPSIFPQAVASFNREKRRRQQVSRHLKKGVVPSVFPWTKSNKTISPAWSGSAEQEVAYTRENKSSNKQTESSQKQPIKVEQNDDEQNQPIKVEENRRKKRPVKSEPEKSTQSQTNEKGENNTLRLRSARLRDRKSYLASRKCSVPNCNNRLSKSKDISLHPCPNNSVVRNQWAETLKVTYQYVKNMVACSTHFCKTDFVKTKQSGEKVLKTNAVPSRNIRTVKRDVLSANNKTTKTDIHITERTENMTSPKEENVTENVKIGKESHECRACLKSLADNKSSCNVYQAWALPWEGMEATIAEDLAKLANIEITMTDRHSKIICEPCYKKLLDAASFAAKVRRSDLILRQRFTEPFDQERVWPKPIQVDKNIDGSVLNTPMELEIKQEVVSDDEYNASASNYVETELGNMDIKIEPEEFVDAPPLNITINGTISLNPLNSENKETVNGTEEYQEEQYLEPEIKQEPESEEEQEVEPTPDLPLECLLCTKSFHSVTGLKAHVIAQHSYKTVKRKSDGSLSPEKKRTDRYHCDICRRSFLTPTDLMVHETCHNKHACYGCTQKFDSFPLLIQHRNKCKASLANSVPKLKTLDDVKRPMSEEKDDFVKINKIETKTDSAPDIDMLDTLTDQTNTDINLKNMETSIQNVQQESSTDSKEVDEQLNELAGLVKEKNESVNENKDIDIFDVESKLKELMDSDPIESVSQSNELNQEMSDNAAEMSDNAVEMSLRSTLEQD